MLGVNDFYSMHINTLVWEKIPQSRPSACCHVSSYFKETTAITEQT